MSANPILLELSFLANQGQTKNCSPEDSEYEVANMKPGVGQLEVFPTIWGHWAGGPGDSKADLKWLDEHLRNFFSENASENIQM